MFTYSPSSIGFNLTNFIKDLKPGVKATLDLLKRKINCWDCCINFVVPTTFVVDEFSGLRFTSV